MLLRPDVEQQMNVCIEEGVKVITTGAGNPGAFMEKLKAANIKVIPVIPTVKLAERMEKIGADAVIVEGMESGGHVGTLTTMALLPQIVNAVSIPVIAAGGIASGKQFLAALAMGAEAIQCGTIFLTAKECIIHQNYKDIILKAKDRSTIVTGTSTGHPVRVIENKFVFQILDKITSIFRAIPFIILLAILKGFTYFIVGTNLGMTAALVPLSAATFPFFARQVQVVLADLDRGVIEAAQASGATLWDTIKVYLSEGLPELVRVSTVTLISLVGETAMAGAIGAGGLGYIAIYYGYNRSSTSVTILATFLILILIFLIQFLGDFLTRKLSHK